MSAAPPISGHVYAHEREDWPRFHWDEARLAASLARAHFRRGALLTAMAALGFAARRETLLSTLVRDVQDSSAIEGERLDPAQVRSSLARRLGMDAAGLPKPEREVEGVVEMMLDATVHYDAPLTAERIFGWHAALFPSGWSGLSRIAVGRWRDDVGGPMQVVSGPIGKERVHFQAPDAPRIEAEMERFLAWFAGREGDPLVRAALAHLWFVTVHPLDDGNGRVGRAILDMALARADRTDQRCYSLSAEILKEREGYYRILERTQRGTMEVTEWIEWFLARLESALDAAEGSGALVRRRVAFWDTHRDAGLNERQTKVVNLLLEGFRGKLRTEKYARITGCANRTALRDLGDLVEKGILTRDGDASGRSTSYVLALD